MQYSANPGFWPSKFMRMGSKQPLLSDRPLPGPSGADMHYDSKLPSKYYAELGEARFYDEEDE